MQALAEVRLQSLEPSDLTVTDVVRLMAVGVKIEREAMAVPWVSRQRQAHNKGKLTPERIERLEAIGFGWSFR
jgi:hypothetical protein